jgi:hypothetical protein
VGWNDGGMESNECGVGWNGVEWNDKQYSTGAA